MTEKKSHRLIGGMPFVFVELNKAEITNWIFKKPKNDTSAYDQYNYVGINVRGPRAYVRVGWCTCLQEPSEITAETEHDCCPEMGLRIPLWALVIQRVKKFTTSEQQDALNGTKI